VIPGVVTRHPGAVPWGTLGVHVANKAVCKGARACVCSKGGKFRHTLLLTYLSLTQLLLFVSFFNWFISPAGAAAAPPPPRPPPPGIAAAAPPGPTRGP